MPIGMLVTLDAIFNRVIQNWKKGKTTWVFADEFYLLFRYQYSADFFYKLWKRIRKYNGLGPRLGRYSQTRVKPRLPNVQQQSAVDRFNEWIEAAPSRLSSCCGSVVKGLLA